MNTDRITRSISGDKDEALVQRVVEKVLSNPKFLDRIITAINDRISGLDSKMKEHEQKVVSLETKLFVAENSIEKQEQYSRANNLRIFGLPEKSSENPEQVVIALCREKLKINISNNDIDCCHRLSAKEGTTVKMVEIKLLLLLLL